MKLDTLVILPSAPSTSAATDLLVLLAHQRLLRRLAVRLPDRTFAWLDHHGLEPTTLDDVLRLPFEHFTIVNLVTADTPEIGSQLDEAHAIAQQFIDAVSVQHGAHQQLTLINLVAPSGTAESMPRSCWTNENAGNWANVVLSPEVQSVSSSAVVLARPDGEYIAATVTGLASVAGLWSDGELLRRRQSGFTTINQNSVNQDMQVWHVVRTRSRTLLAPELADQVIGRILRLNPPPLSTPGTEYITFDGDSAEHLTDLAVGVLVTKHRLEARDPVPRPAKRRRWISFREFLALLRSFATLGLVRLLREQIEARVHDVRRFAEDRLNQMIGSDELDFSVGLGAHRGDDAEDGEPGGRTGTASLLGPPLSDESPLWQDLRGTAFGLIDGGRCPAEIADLVTAGSRRIVIGDRTAIVRPQRGGVVGDLDSEDSAVTAAFVDKMVGRIRQGQEASREIAESITRRIEALEEARRAREESDRVAWRRWLRRIGRALRTLALIALVALIAVALFVVAPIVLPLAGIALVVWFVLSGAIMLFGAARWAFGLWWSWFKQEHAQRGVHSEIQVLEAALQVARAQVERFDGLARAVDDWHPIIATMVHEPFGASTITERPRVRGADLHLPPHHQVIEPRLNDTRRVGIANSIARRVYSAGWMTLRYERAVSHASVEYALRHAGDPFTPDSDRRIGSTATSGPRAVLRREIISGNARRSGRHDLAVEVYRALTAGVGLHLDHQPLESWLFDDIDGVSPLTFLEAAIEGTPARWNKAFIGDGHPTVAAVEQLVEVRHDEHASVDPADSVRPADLDMSDLPPLLFRSWGIEGSLNVSEQQILSFSDHPVPVTIDTSSIGRQWRLPDDLDRGEVLRLSDDSRSLWSIPVAELPLVGERISPRGVPVPPAEDGPYSFLVEVDGEPARHAHPVLPYQVRVDQAPPNGAEIIRYCLQLTADTSGLTFEFAGILDGLPDREERQDSLLIAWAFADEYERYEAACGRQPGTTIGLGGPVTRSTADGNVVIVGGTAVMNAEMKAVAEIAPSPSHSVVLLHELGHALNLAHVNCTTEIMDAGALSVPIETWGPGDRTGLMSLGRVHDLAATALSGTV